MGIRNVSAGLLINADELTNGARITLLTLCMLTYDFPQGDRNAREYWGGWQMAMIRQGAYPDEASKRRFLRHMAELRERGYVKLVHGGRSGTAATYALVLPVDNYIVSVDDDPY